MADRNLRPCAHAGCAELVTSGYCDSHAKSVEFKRKQDKQKYLAQRGSSSARGYDAEWQKARAMYLSSHPLCEICLGKGKTVAAELVHHKIPISEGGERLSYSNMQSQCNDCHEDIHAKDRWKRKE